MGVRCKWNIWMIWGGGGRRGATTVTGRIKRSKEFTYIMHTPNSKRNFQILRGISIPFWSWLGQVQLLYVSNLVLMVPNNNTVDTLVSNITRTSLVFLFFICSAFSSSIRSTHNHHSDYSGTVMHNLCFKTTGQKAFSLSKGGCGISNVCNKLSVCFAQDTGKGTMTSLH